MKQIIRIAHGFASSEKAHYLVALAVLIVAMQPASAQNAQMCVPAGTPASYRGSQPPLVSPEISSNQTVRLRFCAPDARDVRVFGDWNAKNRQGDALVKDEQGVWSIQVPSLKPDLYNYWFMVDGVKTIDPSNVHSDGDAVRIDSYFIISTPGDESVLYENEDVLHGEVTAVWYASHATASPRRALVYTPPGYPSGTQRYPVLYLLHGWGGDESEWIENGRVAQILDNLIAARKVIPMIVVMPNGHPDRRAIPDIAPPSSTALLRPFPPPGFDNSTNVSEIAKSLVSDLVPYIDENFRTERKNTSRAIAGLSMGGGQSLYTGLNHPDMFAWVASFSGAIVMWPGASLPASTSASATDSRAPMIPQLHLNADAVSRNLPALDSSINSRLKLLYISCGLDDGLVTSNQEFEQWLTAHGIRFEHKEVPGYAHVWSFWRKSLVEIAPVLFR